VPGSDVKCKAVRWHVLLMAICIGRMFACASSVMVGVKNRAPVMKMAEVHWTWANLVSKPTEPCFFFLPGFGLWIG